jgi:hypothetical protein
LEIFHPALVLQLVEPLEEGSIVYMEEVAVLQNLFNETHILRNLSSETVQGLKLHVKYDSPLDPYRLTRKEVIMGDGAS